jgi:hypothetical protein
VTAFLAVAALVVVAGCSGEPRDLGTVSARDPQLGQDMKWTLLEVGGTAFAGNFPADFVKVDDDGLTATVFFKGGRPSCNALTGVALARRDPEPPTATVSYGMRLGVMVCTADLWNLAVRVPLDPPFDAEP